MRAQHWKETSAGDSSCKDPGPKRLRLLGPQPAAAVDVVPAEGLEASPGKNRPPPAKGGSKRQVLSQHLAVTAATAAMDQPPTTGEYDGVYEFREDDAAEEQQLQSLLQMQKAVASQQQQAGVKGGTAAEAEAVATGSRSPSARPPTAAEAVTGVDDSCRHAAAQRGKQTLTASNRPLAHAALIPMAGASDTNRCIAGVDTPARRKYEKKRHLKPGQPPRRSGRHSSYSLQQQQQDLQYELQQHAQRQHLQLNQQPNEQGQQISLPIPGSMTEPGALQRRRPRTAHVQTSNGPVMQLQLPQQAQQQLSVDKGREHAEVDLLLQSALLSDQQQQHHSELFGAQQPQTSAGVGGQQQQRVDVAPYRSALDKRLPQNGLERQQQQLEDADEWEPEQEPEQEHTFAAVAELESPVEDTDQQQRGGHQQGPNSYEIAGASAQHSSHMTVLRTTADMHTTQADAQEAPQQQRRGWWRRHQKRRSDRLHAPRLSAAQLPVVILPDRPPPDSTSRRHRPNQEQQQQHDYMLQVLSEAGAALQGTDSEHDQQQLLLQQQHKVAGLSLLIMLADQEQAIAGYQAPAQENSVQVTADCGAAAGGAAEASAPPQSHARNEGLPVQVQAGPQKVDSPSRLQVINAPAAGTAVAGVDQAAARLLVAAAATGAPSPTANAPTGTDHSREQAAAGPRAAGLPQHSQQEQQQLQQCTPTASGASQLCDPFLSGSVEDAITFVDQLLVNEDEEQEQAMHTPAAAAAAAAAAGRAQSPGPLDRAAAAADVVAQGSAPGHHTAACPLPLAADATRCVGSRSLAEQQPQSQRQGNILAAADPAAVAAALEAAAVLSAAAHDRDTALTPAAGGHCLTPQQPQLQQQIHQHPGGQNSTATADLQHNQQEHLIQPCAAAAPAEGAQGCSQDDVCQLPTYPQPQQQQQHPSDGAGHRSSLHQLQQQHLVSKNPPQQQGQQAGDVPHYSLDSQHKLQEPHQPQQVQELQQQQQQSQGSFCSQAAAHPACNHQQQQCPQQCDPAVPPEVLQLLCALCVLLRLSDGDQLADELRAVSRLPELPACDNRGRCRACAHHEPLVAYVVGGLNQPTFNIYCSNCYHLVRGNSNNQQQQQQASALSCVPAVRHKRGAGMKALRDDAVGMRLLPGGAMRALILLAEQFGPHLRVPDFSCCSQAKPHLLTTPEISDQPAGQQQQQQPHRIGLVDASNLSISHADMLGMLGGLIHCHLEGPVHRVGGDTRVHTSAALARNMLTQVMHAGQYAHCNPVTERLNQAQHVIQDHLAEQCLGSSPAEAAAGAVAAVQQMVCDEELEKFQKQAAAAAAAHQAAITAAAAAASGQQPAAGDEQRSSGRQTRGKRRRKAAIAAAVQQEVGNTQQQQAGDGISPTAWAVHLLNIFILTVMFSKAVNGHYWCRGQVLSYILMLIGSTGTRTAGHIDPAAALTFAWPWLQPGEVWSDQLRDVPLATWLFVSPCAQAWQRLLEWLTLRQQDKTSSEQQHQAADEVAPARIPDDVVRSALEGVELQPHEVDQLVGYVGEEHTVVLQQCAGQAVCVEPGWKHWVFNRRPCFKIAFELMRPDQACVVVHMQQQLRGKMRISQADYMKTGCVVVDRLVEWARWYCRKAKQQQEQQQRHQQ